MSHDTTPHDGAQSQVEDKQEPSTERAAPPVPPAPEFGQPAIAAPGKPDGEVDTRR